jgi:hypothetical protein
MVGGQCSLSDLISETHRRILVKFGIYRVCTKHCAEYLVLVCTGQFFLTGFYSPLRTLAFLNGFLDSQTF